MERLGEDEIFSIFERITDPKDKKAFAKVCKKFLKVACFHLCRLRNTFPDLLFDMLIACPRMLSFECFGTLSNNHMKLIAESCPNIKYLNLSYYNHEVGKLEFDDVGLCAIADACINLVDVDLYGRLGVKEIGIGSLVRSCKNLRDLCLEGCVNVTDRSLKVIAEATCLKRLNLAECCLISDVGFEYLANGELKYCLKLLRFHKCDRITDNGIIHLKKLVSLTTLDLSECDNATDYGVVWNKLHTNCYN